MPLKHVPQKYSYRVFDRFMTLNKFNYNRKQFVIEDMYFCKVWKSNRYDFSKICIKYKCENVFIDLNLRCQQFEFRILENKYKNGQISNREYSDLHKEIFKSYF